MARKLIGEILREHGKVTEEQITKALERQEISDEALGRILFDMGSVTDGDVLEAWSEQLGAPIVDLSQIEVPDDVIAKLPREVAEKHHAFPVEFKGDALVLAISDPLDDAALDEIASASGCKIETVVGSALGIAHAIARHYRK